MRSFSLRSAGRLLRRARDERGQSVVEFAFVVPILVIIIIGMVEFARVWMQYQVVTDAAREAARMAVIADDVPIADKRNQILDAVSEAAAVAGIPYPVSPYWETADGACQTVSTGTQTSEVELYECDWDGDRGVPARVTIRAPYEFAFLKAFIPGQPTIMLNTSFTMRNE